VSNPNKFHFISLISLSLLGFAFLIVPPKGSCAPILWFGTIPHNPFRARNGSLQRGCICRIQCLKSAGLTNPEKNLFQNLIHLVWLIQGNAPCLTFALAMRSRLPLMGAT
jgi:hypothetical protein